jgi:lysophospholipase L1-like esterase
LHIFASVLGNISLTTRLLPLVITIGLMIATTSIWCLRERKSIRELLRTRLGFSCMVFFFMLAIHLNGTQIFYAKLGLFRAVWLGIAMLFLAWILVHHFVRRGVAFPRWFTGLFTAISGLATILIILEITFIFPSRTHGFAITFSSMNWYYRYGGPYDEEGYRERVIPEGDFAGKKIMLLIGDSFLAGSGVRDINDRFSAHMQEALKNQFIVVNRGQGGNDTKLELASLRSYKHKPDLVVLCWVPNDIFVAAESVGYQFPNAPGYEDVNPVMRFFASRSYLGNYLYWSRPHVEFPGFADLMKSLYKNQTVLDLHFKDLAAIKSVCDSLHAPLAVVLFPHMNAESGYCIEPIKQFLNSAGIPSLDLQPVYRNLPVADLIVNPNDAHPNEKAHQLAADAILEFLSAQRLVR